jgi:hypothetical protein
MLCESTDMHLIDDKVLHGDVERPVGRITCKVSKLGRMIQVCYKVPRWLL